MEPALDFASNECIFYQNLPTSIGGGGQIVSWRDLQGVIMVNQKVC